MTLRELYDHYARFQPEALDAQLTVQIDGDITGYKNVEGHTFHAGYNQVFFFVHLQVEYTMEIENSDY